MLETGAGSEFGSRMAPRANEWKAKKGSPGIWSAVKKFPTSCSKNLPLTLVCGFVTILVLRGALGFNVFSSSTPSGATVWEDEGAEEDEGNYEHFRNLAEINESSSETGEFPDPESGDPSVPYSLGLEIKDWNEQRVAWLENHPQKNAQGRILMVTGSPPTACENPMGDNLLLKSIKNKIDYCRLHDIDIFYNFAHIDAQMTGFWSKLPLIRRLMLGHPEVEWIWWMDSDALVTDMRFELPLQKYEDHSMVLHGWDDLVYEKHNWVGLNTGSFLLRNNQWSLDLLDMWAPMGPQGAIRIEAGKLLTAKLAGRPTFEADDQSALIYLLATREEELRPHLYLESSYYLHGYWVNLVDSYDELMANSHPGLGDDRWPFVTHFVGCKPCGRYNSYDLEKCVSSMERAFNFADNQVLDRYGLQHNALNSPKVKRIRNDSSTPLELLGQSFWTPAA